MRYLPLLLFALLLFSCGKQETSEKPREEEVIKIDGSNIQGVYETPLAALNINTTLGIIGSAGLHRSSDIFKAFVKIYIGEKGVTHRQTIHLGSRCPTIDDDINGDGYIDYREAHFVVGNVIMPLDGDLDSQWGGMNSYPIGNGIAGGYFYERTASFTRMFEDLRDVDNNTLDEVDKIPYDEGLSFHKKVILIEGVSTAIRLPDSVDTMEGIPKYRSLPIACGVLVRSSKFPSELYDRSDPMTTSSRPSPRINTIHPRTPEHHEPDPDVITPIPDPDPPRRGGLRQRIRRWVRGTFGNGGDDNGTHPTE
jgi:hypothetical protein